MLFNVYLIIEREKKHILKFKNKAKIIINRKKMSAAVLEPPPTPANFSINSILASSTSAEATIVPSIQ